MKKNWLIIGLVTALTGCSVNPAKLSEGELQVIAFLGTECPFSQNYTHTLNQLYRKFASPTTKFIGYFPEPDDTRSRIQAFAEHYQIEFDLQPDHRRIMTNHLNATVTPEVFLLSDEGVLYSGKIDNWAIELGKRRKVITEHYLEDALKAAMKGDPVPVAHTEPVGCFISSGKH